MEPVAETVLERLRARPEGARLLDAVAGLESVYLVGGAVRDLMLGRDPKDLDLVVERDGPAAAAALASALGHPPPVVHDRFGTAAIDGINVATARAESYPQPGALPQVRAGSMGDDMARRDFTANAIAVGVSGDRVGRVVATPGAVDDLEGRRLRVLHDASFVDDPTRLVRLARYAARLGFAVDEDTAFLAREAFAVGAPATAGRARMGAELLLLLAEPDPVAALVALRSLAGDADIDPGLDVDEDLLARLSYDPVVLLAALLRGVDEERVAEWLRDIHHPQAGAVLDAARDPEALAAEMRAASRPSELWRLLRRRTPQAVELAGALGAPGEARRWSEELRDVRLGITGDDLLAAGVPQGPEVGAMLEAAMARKLDEGLATREEELAAALEARG